MKNQNLEILTKYLPIFDNPDFLPGEWLSKPGVMPMFSQSKELSAFVRDFYDHGFIVQFEWHKWRFKDSEENIAKAQTPVCSKASRILREDKS